MLDQANPHRHSNRMQGYDYTLPGGYFITLVTWSRCAYFGSVINETVALSPFGKIAHNLWDAIPTHFPHVQLDEFVIMPNHIHGILIISDPPVRATHASPLPEGIIANGPIPHSIGAIIGSYKSAVSKLIHRQTPGLPVWHRNYYDHIIRNDTDLDRIRLYIQDNPRRWAEDEENPDGHLFP